MALTACRECGKPISTTAPACPHCGHRMQKEKVGCARVIVAVFAALLFLVVILFMTSKTPPSTPTSAADEERFRQEVGALLYIKNQMKNPASFELVSFVRTSADALCIVYRGTNSFNAVITQQHTITDNTNSASAAAWVQHCQDETGTDVSKAKYALP